MFSKIKPPIDIPLHVGTNQCYLAKNIEYIIPNAWKRIINIQGEPYQFNKLNFNNNIDSIDLNNKKILFIRTYAFGDLLIISGLVHYLKHKFPNCQIDFAIVNDHHIIITKYMSKIINRAISIPLKVQTAEKYDYHVTFSGLVEHNPNTVNKNIYDIYFENIGIDPSSVDDEYKRPYPLEDVILQPNDNVIGIHPFAGSYSRSFNPHIVFEVCRNTNKLVYLFSNKQQYNSHIDLFKPLRNVRWIYAEDMSIKHTIDRLAECPVLYCTDSSMLHFAQSIGVKTVVNFGPIPAEARVKYYKNIVIRDTHPDCRCNTHGEKCPKLFKYSPCMNTPLEFFNDKFDIQQDDNIKLIMSAYNINGGE